MFVYLFVVEIKTVFCSNISCNSGSARVSDSSEHFFSILATCTLDTFHANHAIIAKFSFVVLIFIGRLGMDVSTPVVASFFLSTSTSFYRTNLTEMCAHAHTHSTNQHGYIYISILKSHEMR